MIPSTNDVQRVAKIDARGWYNRNQDTNVTENAIRNHYSMSRDRGYLGSVSVAPRGGAWEAYRAEFIEEIARQHNKRRTNDVQKSNATRGSL